MRGFAVAGSSRRLAGKALLITVLIDGTALQARAVPDSPTSYGGSAFRREVGRLAADIARA